MSTEQKLYSLSEAAEYLNSKGVEDNRDKGRNKEAWSSRHLLYLVKTDQIKAQKVGWIWVISEEELKRLIKKVSKTE